MAALLTDGEVSGMASTSKLSKLAAARDAAKAAFYAVLHGNSEYRSYAVVESLKAVYFAADAEYVYQLINFDLDGITAGTHTGNL